MAKANGRRYICIWDFAGQTPHTGVTLENITANGGINFYNVDNAVLRDVTSVADKYYSIFCNGAATITIESGTYSCTSNSIALLAYYKDNPAKGLIINGGTFLTNGKPFSLHTVSGNTTNYLQPTVRGGIFDVDITTQGITLEEGYSIHQISENRWEVTENN